MTRCTRPGLGYWRARKVAGKCAEANIGRPFFCLFRTGGAGFITLKYLAKCSVYILLVYSFPESGNSLKKVWPPVPFTAFYSVRSGVFLHPLPIFQR